MQKFGNVLEDTNTVLSHEPTNLKALYRRALAFEAIEDLDSAIKDVEKILCIQPQNEFALEALKRFKKAQQTVNATANQMSTAQKSEVDSNMEVKCDKESVDEIQKSINLKTQGNEAMKAGRCEAAIDFYTRAIACDPSNVLFFNNRAQAFLKTSQFAKAEADASYVIQHNTDEEPNLKAYYRRALARKGINTIESLKFAQQDITFILSHEPDNKAAIFEKKKVDSLLTTLLGLKKDELNKKKTVEECCVITKPSDDKTSMNGLKERTSKVKLRINSSSDSSQNQAHLTPMENASSPSTCEREKKHSIAPAALKTKAAKDISVKNPIVPVEPPKTVYEFERIWRGLKNRPDLFAVYLKCFKKSTYKRVLKETCSPDLLSSMLISVRDYLLVSDNGNIEKGVSVLEGLSSIPKYDMIRFVLPATDLDCLRACIEFVSVHLGAEKSNRLREKLKM